MNPLHSITLAAGLALAAPAQAEIIYTMAPVPCEARLLRIGSNVSTPLPCMTISGTFTVDDRYVPGTEVPFRDPSFDWLLSLRFEGTELIGVAISDDTLRSLDAGGSHLSMPVDSGVASIGINLSNDVTLTGDLTLTEHKFDPSRDLIYSTTTTPIWTLQQPSQSARYAVPEPGTLALASLVGILMLGMRRRAIA